MSMPQQSVFIPDSLQATMRGNLRRFAWTRKVRDAAAAAAQPWLAMDDAALWDLMFGPTITRSWMVWSDGHCPVCRERVPMYNWVMDALAQPWKVRCPHCRELFPKNDFAAFYRSGLDARSVFDPARADRRLLVNPEHPDPQDPLHHFGVDDGEGYVDGDKRWRFIGAYLIYGQWKQAVVAGIVKLADAYLLTGERACARKALILLDRVADLYPSFDHRNQAWVYETVRTDGYVSTWHDACEETRQMVLAYDLVRGALDIDPDLVAFLAQQAQRHGLANSKGSAADIRRNIETGILRDALASPAKTHSNFPRREIEFAVINLVLDTPESRAEAERIIDDFVAKATAVDGITGEKGLAGYSSYTIKSLAEFLAQLERRAPGTLAALVQRHPNLRRTWRFHLDTWVDRQYYPQIGDVGWFAARETNYVGAHFAATPSLHPSMFTFFWQLYKATGDTAFVQVLTQANNGTPRGLPHDLFATSPRAFQQEVAAVLAGAGTWPVQESVNLREWHVALLRGKATADKTPPQTAWLSYDTGGGHSHANALNLGLYAFGLDLMPDFGYPPVHFGGWGTPRALWYTKAAAHNTVVVDGKDHSVPYRGIIAGSCELWAVGEQVQAIRASVPVATRLERTVVRLELPRGGCCLVDVFRVAGGRDHAKFMHSHFGSLATHGLTLEPAPDYGHDTFMREFRAAPAAKPGWHADWTVKDHYGYRKRGPAVHLRYTDLSEGASAATCAGWLTAGSYNSTEEAWIPRLMIRRTAKAEPLVSTFIAVIEAYTGKPQVRRVRRVAVTQEDRLPNTSRGSAPQTPAGGAATPCTRHSTAAPVAEPTAPAGPSGVPPDPPHGTDCIAPAWSADPVALELVYADGTCDVIVLADVSPGGRAYPRAASDPLRLTQADWGLTLDGELGWARRAPDGAVTHLFLANGRHLRCGNRTLQGNGGSTFA